MVLMWPEEQYGLYDIVEAATVVAAGQVVQVAPEDASRIGLILSSGTNAANILVTTSPNPALQQGVFIGSVPLMVDHLSYGGLVGKPWYGNCRSQSGSVTYTAVEVKLARHPAPTGGR